MKHDNECAMEIAAINTEIETARNIIAVETEQFEKASAFHNGMAIEHGKESAFKRELCKELRKTFKACYDKLKELERAMCGMLKIRQAVYNKIKNPDKSKPEMIIQDCEMEDWVVGECTATCREPDSGLGLQIIKRV